MAEVKAARRVNLRHRAANSNPARPDGTTGDGWRSTHNSALRHASRRNGESRVMRCGSAANVTGCREDLASGSTEIGLRCSGPVASGG